MLKKRLCAVASLMKAPALTDARPLKYAPSGAKWTIFPDLTDLLYSPVVKPRAFQP